MESAISAGNVACNENNSSGKTPVDPFATLMGVAKNSGHSITSALARLQNELKYSSCTPLDDPDTIGEVVKLGGADFKAGDLAVTAIRDFGVSPRAIYDWCEDVALDLTRGWKDERRAEQLLKGVVDRGQLLMKRSEHDEAVASEQLHAFRSIGLARLLLAEDATRPLLDWCMDFILDKDTNASAIGQISNTILSFAWNLVTGSSEAELEMVEMHMRGFMRQVCAVTAITGDDAFNSDDLLDELASVCSRHANHESCARRAVLSGEVVEYAKALEDMQAHAIARYQDEEGVVYAWVGGRLMCGMNHGAPRENENSEESNAQMMWRRVDPCTVAEMKAYAAANACPTAEPELVAAEE